MPADTPDGVNSVAAESPTSGVRRKITDNIRAAHARGIRDENERDANDQGGSKTTPPPDVGRDLDSRVVSLPIGLRIARQSGPTLRALQEWEGYVVEIGERDFTARLTDLTKNSSYEDAEAVIPFAEIADDDADRMRLGSVLRWVIGYERSPSETKKRVSQFVFRNLPAVTRTDLEEGEEWARRVLQSFD